MAANTIARIYKSHETHFLKNLKGAQTLDEEKLHRLRVDIKNIRVLTDLLRNLGSGKSRHNGLIRILNPLFKSAGRTRTASLNIRHSEQYKSQVLDKFRRHLRFLQEEANADFLKAVKKFDEKRFHKLHRKALKDFKTLKEKDILKGSEAYLRKHFTFIRAGIFDINDDEALHQIRKKLKSIKNIGMLLDRINKGHSFTTELKKVDHIYEQIGNWHDKVELVSALEDYIDDLDDPKALENSAPLILLLKKSCLEDKFKIEARLKKDLVL